MLQPTQKTFRIEINNNDYLGSDIEITRYYDTNRIRIHSFSEEGIRLPMMTLKEAALWFGKVEMKLNEISNEGLPE